MYIVLLAWRHPDILQISLQRVIFFHYGLPFYLTYYTYSYLPHSTIDVFTFPCSSYTHLSSTAQTILHHSLYTSLSIRGLWLESICGICNCSNFFQIFLLLILSNLRLPLHRFYSIFLFLSWFIAPLKNFLHMKFIDICISPAAVLHIFLLIFISGEFLDLFTLKVCPICTLFV